MFIPWTTIGAPVMRITAPITTNTTTAAAAFFLTADRCQHERVYVDVCCTVR